MTKQAADIEAPVRHRLSAAKKAKLEAPYREALAVEADKRTPEQKKLVEQSGVLVKVTWDEIVDALPTAERAKRAALREQIHALEGVTARAPGAGVDSYGGRFAPSSPTSLTAAAT